MGIGRILVIGLLIWLLLFLYSRLKSKAISLKSKNANSTKNAKSNVSTVRQCAVCSVHVPEDEAIKKNGLYYCSSAHAHGSENN